MGINFSAFDIGQRALRASQLGITVAGQNIANVNTPGYTRQEIVLSASPPAGANLKIGTGVNIDDVRSLRDRFIEARLQTETGISGRLVAQRDALSPVDTLFSETGSSVNNAITNFFGSFRTLESNPTSLSLRTAVIEDGKQLALAFNATNARLGEIRRDADGLLRATVDNVNNLSITIADLNQRINIAEGSGGKALELRDQRGEAVRSLAELTGVKTTENRDGTLTLTLGDGRPLVLANRAFSLKAESTPPDGLAAITLDGQPAVINNGRLRGLSDAIGQIGAQITGLNDLAGAIAGRVNTTHTSGIDLDGGNGTPFFTVPANGDPITAANLSVAPNVAASPRRVVAAAAGANTGDGSVARSIANLLTDNTSQAGTRTGSFTSLYSSLVSDAGEALKSAEDALSTQQVILAQTTEQRNAISGVSLDEEAVNLLRYQRAFEAAARFLKVADEVTQTVIALGGQ